MKCELPQSYIAELPSRIIAARKRVLRSLLPSGVTGGGGDGWWDGAAVQHEDGTIHYLSGNRWKAESTVQWGGISESGRTLTVKFTVTNTAVATGERWPCDQCG